MRSIQKGFSVPHVLLAVLTVGILGGIGYIVYAKSKSAGTDNAVAREAEPSAKQTASPTAKESVQPKDDPYSGMTKYTNTKHGISFHHPAAWQTKEQDPQLSMDTEKTQLSLWLTDTTLEEGSSAAAFIVIDRPRDVVTQGLEGFARSHGGDITDSKSEKTINGKNAVIYAIPQTEDAVRMMYYFAVGSKTYSMQTIEEEKNVAHNPSYMADIEKMVSSLELP